MSDLNTGRDKKVTSLLAALRQMSPVPESRSVMGSKHLYVSANLDYISNLPDPILGYILSHIPTKSAVATSILSKRWKTVWTKVPALDFTEMPRFIRCCSLGPQEKVFEAFVDKVLSSNDVSSIEIFRLHLFNGIRPRHANSWLLSSLKRDILEIDLTCHCPSLKLPAAFFTREKLVVLKLTCFLIDVPDTLHLPNLESLYLIHTRFNEKSLKNLTSGCPVLKEVAIDSCKGIPKLTISSSSLKSLEIKDTVSCDAKSAIIIEAPNLEILHLSDLADQYDFSNLSLVKAVLTIHDRGINHREKLAELLRGICSLRILKLGRVTLEVLQDVVLSKLPAFRNIKLPVFHNLITLELTVGNRSMILHMLECTPSLQSLILYNYSRRSQNDWSGLPSVPKCLKFTLQEISIDHLSRDEADMKMACYLLQNSKVLKKLKLYIAPHSPPGRNADIVEKLREKCRQSSRCEIVLCQH